MNFVGNDRESEPWKSFWVFVEGTKSDSLVYLLGCYVFYWSGSNGDNSMAEEFRGNICW